jgi:5-(carboxyamino)imidazole ribonucleotide synthase
MSKPNYTVITALDGNAAILAPNGDTHRLFDAEMINLIGEAGVVSPASLGPNDTLTLYGKREARPGRKMGHITRRLGPRKD